MTNTQALLNLGLTENEAQIYLFLLYHPQLSAAKVAREINLDKSSCYRAVENLTSKGLLIVTPRQRGSTYSAVNPEILKDIVQKKRIEFEQQSKSIDSLIDKLATDTSLSGLTKTNVRVEKGFQAVINMMEDRLIGEPRLIRERWFSGHPHIQSSQYAQYVKNYANRRVEKNIFLNGLYSQADLDVAYPELIKSSAEYKKEVRIWPEELADNRHLFTVYGDKVAFISPKKDDLVVVTLQDEILADLISSMFDFIWSRSKQI